MSHTIELRRVSKFYSNNDTVSTGFSRVDLTLDMGEFVVITGESGSGKSTLLNVISGLDTYEEGEMFVCGEDTSGYRTEDYERYRKTYIGNIFQDFNLINSYSVYQNIELSMLISGRGGRERRARINELIDLVDLNDYRRTKASKLSGGQKQRVAIARALAKDAPIIVADEPTGNLDSESAQKVMETLSRISKDKLVVIVTHNYEQAEPYVTRKLTMHDGRIIEDKKIREASDAGSPQASGGPEGAGDLYDALMDLYDGSPAVHTGVMLSERDRASIRRRGTREMAREAAAREAAAALPEADSKANRMRLMPQIRLGVRNTFNLPAKFALLLAVYLFVALAVIGQYASTKENAHQNENLGWNDFFTNASVDRIILKRDDGKPFGDADYTKIASIENVDYIVKNDLALDIGIMADSEDVDISGPVYPADLIDPDDIEMGGMPQGDLDIVLEISPDSWAYDSIMNMGDNIIGKEYYIGAYGGSIDYGERLIPDKVKIAGIIVRDETGADADLSGESRIYASDHLSNQILIRNVAASSPVVVDYTGDKARTEGVQIVYPTEEVEEGQAYISEQIADSYYDEGYARNKDITITVENMYFTSSVDLTIYAVFSEEDINYWLGIDSDDYDVNAERIFINPKDFEKLYDQGNYQVSVFMEDEMNSPETVKALNEAGYTTFVMKESLTDVTGGFEFVVNLMTRARLFFLFIVLFFIAYAVIRLIMRSRNTYYSTLRILGANKSNTARILRVELVLMMLIACFVCAALIYMLVTGMIDTNLTYYFTERLKFLTPRDYIILFAAMLLMSLMISQRYSRRIFRSSAMNVYREEV